MQKLLILLLVLTIQLQPAKANEGMWLPLLLKQLNEAEMQEMGMKMSAEDIYSVNKGSLKDAIVLFGRGCTGELISDRGLLLTNHHCGFGTIQSHTTLENNYIDDGFWAMEREKELANPGLTVTFLVEMKDITERVLSGINDQMAEAERQSLIDKNIAAIKDAIEIPDYEHITVKPFYKGNAFYLLHTITYSDVRLVGAPPSSIGKFGADTDNWEWPRHTGDFALFRVYAGPDNLPAEYNENNVPFKPKHFFPISIKGLNEGDFTMIFGYPARTNEYLPAIAVEQVINDLNPPRIAIRDKALAILDADMKADADTRIKYVSKFAGIANAWKKWIGESQGLQKTRAVEKKKALEKEFQSRLSKDPALNRKYGQLLASFKEIYSHRGKYVRSAAMFSELTSVIEAFRIAGELKKLESAFKEGGEAGYNMKKPGTANWLKGRYKNLKPATDQKVFDEIMRYYIANVPKSIVPNLKNSLNLSTAKKRKKSILYNENKLMAALNGSPKKLFSTLKSDPIYSLYVTMSGIHNKSVAAPYSSTDRERERLQRHYMKALMEVFPEKTFFPDANFTLRVSYGKVEGYKPRDGITYTPFTHLSGVMDKYKPGDYEFDVPEKLRKLYEAKDFGRYGVNGKMPVCFLGSNHTSGGNSGSPVIDAYGNLIGINFDRVWEGTMSDINYDKSICRNIMVDARYILFIIDKYASATHLIEEMNILE